MKLIFRHPLRSSRAFVFENIMDLEHVCVLHRRWFENLRVRIERPDYVEYRLTGKFYGLRQQVLARGGPVLPDRYWYEFITAVARMRVDGNLEGDDGNLTQTEEITFHFAALLAPIMWLSRPLFVVKNVTFLQRTRLSWKENMYLKNRDSGEMKCVYRV